MQVIYPAIKASDPNAQVLLGGLLLDCDPNNPPENPPGSGTFKNCLPAKFTEGVLVSGGGNAFDGVIFHGYDYYQGELGKYGNSNWHSTWDQTGPVGVIKAKFLRDLLNQYGYPEKYLINTETSIICGRTGQEPACQDTVFMETKALYVVQTYVSAIADT